MNDDFILDIKTNLSRWLSFNFSKTIEMNIFTIITVLSVAEAFHITAKVDQPDIKTIRMIGLEETTKHCFRLLKSLITVENRSEVAAHTMMLAKKCSKIQAVRATIQKLTLKHRNRYSLWW